MRKVKLSDVCSPKQWKTIPTNDLLDEGYPVYGANGIIGYYNEYNHEDPVVAITCRGATCGSINITVPKAYVTGNAMCMDDVRSDIEMEYLYYCLKHYDFNKVISGSAQPQITRHGMNKIYITVYTHDEQISIVNKLKKVERVIELRKQELQSLDDLIKARFVEMFGDPKDNPYEWEEVNISEVVGGKVSNGFFAKRDEYTDDGNISVLGVANIVNRMYSKIDNLPRTNANDKDIEKFEVKYGDMLFCRSSLVTEGIGKASIVPENVQEKVLFECHVIRLPLNLNKCVPEYMQLLSTTDYFRTQVISHSKTATMTTIGQDGILSTSIILPPIDKQREFYCFIKQVDKSKFIQMNSTI